MGKERRGHTLLMLLKNVDHKIGAEIGSFKGRMAKALLNGLPELEQLICVDPGIHYPDFDKVIVNDKTMQMNFDKDVYHDFFKNIKGNEDRVSVLRSFSSEAAPVIEDESLDFVFIDGNHLYEYVREDIELGYPKVKKSGFVSGHDYGKDPKKFPEFGVDSAVHEIFGNNFNVRNSIWYLTKE